MPTKFRIVLLAVLVLTGLGFSAYGVALAAPSLGIRHFVNSLAISEASGTPDVSQTPEATESPEATKSPEVLGTPEPSDTPNVSETPDGKDVQGQDGNSSLQNQDLQNQDNQGQNQSDGSQNSRRCAPRRRRWRFRAARGWR